MFQKSSSKSKTDEFSKLSSEEIEEKLAQRFHDFALSKVKITPQEIQKLNKPTTIYLCPKSANIYDIQFIKFRVRDFSAKLEKKNSNTHRPILIDIQKPENYIESESDKNDPQMGRFVRYHLHPEFLNLKTLGAEITFTVGGNQVAKNFRMIERHYFKNKLIKSFDFDFGAALIPNSTNSIEHIYEMPKMTDKIKREMENLPWETKSDSFYFIDNKLVMHNKAEYAYNFEG